MKVLLSGNEAIAYGAYAAGVTVASGYPGTPSTEILENIVKYEGINAAWAPNEKVALEVAVGASLGGARTIVTMKHVGVNVAADPLFTLAYTGVSGGIVIISADDPEMHSSQNEQDNRHYARAAKVPMLEASDSQEAASLVEEGFKISELFDTPVILRTTTRVNHSKSLVEVGIERITKEIAYNKNAGKYVMIPANARVRRKQLEDRMEVLQKFSEEFPGNRIEWGSRGIGFITSGISYQYVKDVFPEASVLKLTMTYPLPRNLITDFIKQVDKAIVVEELDPFIEEHIKSWGLSVAGKEYISSIGELKPDQIRKALSDDAEVPSVCQLNAGLPNRPPMLCPGCPHRGVFYELRRLKSTVTGDIGCYTLGALAPLEAMDTCLCMGASIGNASGLYRATGRKDIVAVIGDSTFIHSGITPLIDAVYNKDKITVLILDNRTTAMTGRQDHPGTGYNLQGNESPELDLEKLVRAIGIESVRTLDPYDLKAVKKAIKEETSRDAPSVIIFRRACVLLEKPKKPPLMVNENCNGCKACLKIGCPAISWVNKLAVIEPSQCVGCDVCVQLCKKNAIVKYEAGQGSRV